MATVGGNWGVHLVDQSLQLMGSKPKFVWGKVSHLLNPGDAEDDIQAIIEGENGVIAAIDMTCVDAAKRPSWIINGRYDDMEGRDHGCETDQDLRQLLRQPVQGRP